MQPLLRAFYQSPDYQFIPPAPDALLHWELKRIAKSFKPDIVHGHGLITYSYLAVGGESPTIATLHDYGFSCARRDWLHEAP